ncbi:MAG: hypothetical protein VKQ33_05910 [Candidatus Sericytochromatia bacterium]|nr:hypothetical protein [Candidatus Sericytochromatia bacterium]
MTSTDALPADLRKPVGRPGLGGAGAAAPSLPVPAFGTDGLSLGGVDPVGGSGGIGPREREALIRAVAAEARGERPEVWAAVARTIINYSRRTGHPIPSLIRSSYLSSNYDHNRVYFSMNLGNIERVNGIAAAVDRAIRGEAAVGSHLIFFRDSSGRLPPYADHATKVRLGRMTFFREIPGVQI